MESKLIKTGLEKRIGLAMENWVDIEFDCLPLRSVTRTDAPLDASPKLAEKLVRVKSAIEAHGAFNTYYLHNARCTFHLTNDPSIGSVTYQFEGVVFTDPSDSKSVRAELAVELDQETCSWLNESIVQWLAESVHRAVLVEFNRYIAAGDLQRTRERLEKIESSLEENQGYLGMYL